MREHGRCNRLRQVPDGFMTFRHDGQRIGQQKGAWVMWDANENWAWREYYDYVGQWWPDHARTRATALGERDYRFCSWEEWVAMSRPPSDVFPGDSARLPASTSAASGSRGPDTTHEARCYSSW